MSFGTDIAIAMRVILTFTYRSTKTMLVVKSRSVISGNWTLKLKGVDTVFF